MDNWHSLPGGVSCITHGPYPAGRPESTHVRAVKVPEFVFRGSLINAGCAVLFIPPKYPQYPSGWPFVIMLMPLYVFCCGGPGAINCSDIKTVAVKGKKLKNLVLL